MENNEGFKNVAKLISSLEIRLSKCEEISKSIEKNGVEVEKEIEEYFSRCMNALAARKSTLLADCARIIKDQKKTVEETKTKLKTSIEGCQKTLEAGSLIYSTDVSTAENIWKGTKSLPVPRIENARIRTNLPASLVSTIQRNGSIRFENYCEFSQVDVVSTFAGSTEGMVDGVGENAKFNCLFGICFNPLDSCLYICDSKNSAIRRINMQGLVSTISLPALAPYGIVVNYSNNRIFITDVLSNVIRQVSPTGASVLAGNQKAGDKDGEGVNAFFDAPRGIAIDQATGNLFVSEMNNNKIRKITPQGSVTTLAGNSEYGYHDGNAKTAKFNKPFGLFFDETSQSILVCDRDNDKLRRVSLNGDVSTVCTLERPTAVGVTSNGTILVTSYLKHVIYKVTKQENGAYKAVVVAGTGQGVTKDGNFGESSFKGPVGIAINESASCCFVVEHLHLVRKVLFL